MQATTTAALLAQAQERQESAQTQREAITRASAMSERSMEAMGQVAASAAKGPVVVSNPPAAVPSQPCRHCGAPMSGKGSFCGSCGQPQ
jgi:hypothetical protein